MPEFANWTLEEQKRFWFGLARAVILRWRLGPARLSWLGYSGNAVFKVISPGGIYVLRLHLPGKVRAEYLESELTWLQNLRQNTGLLAPSPVPLPDTAQDKVTDNAPDNSSKVLYTTVKPAQLAPGAVLCSLFEFIAGEPKSAQSLSSADVYAVGLYLGKLHREGQFVAAAGFLRPSMDWQGMFGAESPYAVQDAIIAPSAEQADIFAQVEKRLRAALSAIDRNARNFGLIHGDLLAKNILFRAELPLALDFEYCGWGYFLYDLAPLLWQLKCERAAEYPQLEAAMWRGYISQTGLDEDLRVQLEAFIAARQLLSCRWLLANASHAALRAVAPKLLAERAAELRGFLDSGVLKRKSRTL